MNNTPKPENIRVSVSQIKKFKRCEYAWWREYGPLKIKPPPKPAAALGTKVHGVLEEWILNGTPIPENKAGRIASAGLDKLRPAEELEIERSITLPLTENSQMLCRIDMLGKNRPYVGDHKTTKNFSYALTRAEVLRDPQVLTYCFAGYHETRPPEIDVELIYYRTTGQPVSIAVGGVVSWEDVEANWKQMGEIAEDMAPKKKDPSGDSCTANPGACGDYGGCYHRSVCPFSPQNSAKNPNSLTDLFNADNNGTPKRDTTQANKDKTMNKKTDIRRSLGLLAPDAPPQREQTRPLLEAAALAVRAFTNAGKTSDIDGMLKTMGIAPVNIREVLHRAGQGENVETQTTGAQLDRAEYEAKKSAKKDKMAALFGSKISAPTPPPVNTKPEPAFKPRRCNKEDQQNVAAQILEQFDGTVVPATSLYNWVKEQIAPSNLTDDRWNRILKYAGLEMDQEGNISIGEDEEPEYTEAPKAHDAIHMTAEQIEESEEPSDYVNAAPSVTAPAAPAIAAPLVVLVGCRVRWPDPGNTISFSAWVAPYIAAVEKKAKNPFYVLEMDFGKGKKMLAGVLEAAIHNNKPNGIILVEDKDELISVALPVLIRAGAVVIHG